MYPLVQIRIKSDVQAVVEPTATTPAQVNISNYSDVYAPGNSTKRKHGFQLSGTGQKRSTLQGTASYFGPEGYPGLLSPVSAGDYQIPFKITSDTQPAYLYIVFDLATGQYATKFRLTAGTYSEEFTGNASTIVRVPLREFTGTYFFLTIEEWSVPNATYKLTALTTELSMELGGTSLVRFNCSENLMDAEMRLQPGICEQYADIEIYDRNNTFRQQSLAGQLDAAAEVEIVLVRDDGNTETLGIYETSDWDIDSNSSVIPMNCYDKSRTLENVSVARRQIAETTLHSLLNILFEYIPEVSWRYLDTATRTYCEKVITPLLQYPNTNLRTLLDQICVLGMLRIYWYIDTFIVGRCL